MSEIPIIDRLIEKDGVYYALTKEDVLIFVTPHKHIADMYYAVPEIVRQQAKKIHTLSKDLDMAEDAHSALLMEILANGSNLIH